MSELVERVKNSLDEIRPYLKEDGGDITLVEISNDFTAWVELHGACATCDMSLMTMKAGVEEAIKRAAPEIKAVKSVTELAK